MLLLKQNTKWSNTHKFAWTFLIVFILFQGESFQKSIYNSPSSHDNKNCHQLSSHCHISDAWRYLVHRCELVHYCQDLFFSVKTGTIVVQVAQKLTIIKVVDFSCFDSMVYQSSFSKEVVVRKHHCALSFKNRKIEIWL